MADHFPDPRSADPGQLKAPSDVLTVEYLVALADQQEASRGPTSAAPEGPAGTAGPADAVTWVDSVAALGAMSATLQGCPHVALDCEWRPTHIKGQGKNKARHLALCPWCVDRSEGFSAQKVSACSLSSVRPCWSLARWPASHPGAIFDPGMSWACHSPAGGGAAAGVPAACLPHRHAPARSRAPQGALFCSGSRVAQPVGAQAR